MRLTIVIIALLQAASIWMDGEDALAQRVVTKRVGLADVDERHSSLDPHRSPTSEIAGAPVVPSNGGFTWALFMAPTVEEARVVQERLFARRVPCDILQTTRGGQASFLVVTGQHETRRDALNAGVRLPPGIEAEPWLHGLTPHMVVLDRYDRSSDPVKSPLVTELRVEGEELGWLGEPSPETLVKLHIATEELEAARLADSLAAVEAAAHAQLEAAPGILAEGPLEAVRPVVRGDGLADLHVFAASVYESNISQEREGTASYGAVSGAALLLRTHPRNPVLSISATIARHNYSYAPEWNRVSRLFEAAVAPPLSRKLHAAVRGEASLGGASEDREISNQYSISQMIEYRFTKNDRLQLYGAYRLKRMESPGQNAFKPYTEARFERRLPTRRRIDAGVRYELNRTESERGHYRRLTFDLEYRTPLFSERDLFRARARYRRKSYEARFVEIEDEDVPRQDHQWMLKASWRHELFRRLSVIVDYTFETRDSNDPDKVFDGHGAGVSMVFQML